MRLVALLMLCTVLAGCSSSHAPETTVVALFDNANGLYPGNVVAVLGMKVGVIEEITPRGGGVEVVLRVDGEIPLPAEVRAVTVSDSVLTDRHIELTPPYRGGPRLPRAAVLGPERTATPIEFDGLLAMVEKLGTALGGDGTGRGPIADLLTLGTGVTDGNGDDLRAALAELARALRMSGDGAGTGAALGTVITGLDELSGLAARNDRTLREFGTGIRQLSDLLADQNLGSGDTGALLNRILDTVTDLLRRNQQTLTGLTGNAATITGTLADHQGDIAEFLDVFPLLADNVYNAIDTEAGALRATVDINRLLLDGQMVKEICNLLNLTGLGCNTGDLRDMGPDFGITAILQALAEPK
ncbi:MlaD family protein [Nocardia sp. NPDC057227]|uniref:MlaD family protein n=1 Tax=Nocardia sp. NPDC057227 TaxID=3346056 RepID=UPI00362962A5